LASVHTAERTRSFGGRIVKVIICAKNAMKRSMSDYKKIVIDSGRTLIQEEINIINELQGIFPKTDFFFRIERNTVILYLRRMNIIKFKDKLLALLKKYKLTLENSIFSIIIEKIEGIGSYGIKGGKRIFVGYERERKVKNRQLKILRRGAYFYAVGNTFTQEENKVPEDFLDKIICGDSEEVLKKLPSNCIDLIFTSPPYNFGLGYDTTEDGIDWNKYFDKLFRIFKECIRILKYGGRIIVDVQPLFSDYIPTHQIISNFFMKEKLIWKGEIIWDKHNYNMKYTAWGSWKSPSNPYLKYTWEFLEIFCKGSLKKQGEKENIDISANEFKKWIFAKWDIPPERNMKKFGHPAMFPEELAYRVIKLFSYKGDVVLDPFNGVGTTTLVAKKLGRRFIGIDISEEYCKKAKERLREILPF
jgi:DNA modification methylase